MENIIRNQVISDVFQLVETENGSLSLTRPGMDYTVTIFLSEMRVFLCRGSQEALEALGFRKVGIATATSVHEGRINVAAVNYYRGNLLLGNFYFHDITVCLEAFAPGLEFILPGKLFTTFWADTVHRTVCLSMETNYVNVESILQQMNRAAQEDMEAAGEAV